MTTWKDGGDCGRAYREIVNEDESHVIAKVRIRRSAPYRPAFNPTRPWPEGEAHFRLILNAPVLLEALEKIETLAQRLSLVAYPTPLDWKVVRNCAHAAIAAAKGE